MLYALVTWAVIASSQKCIGEDFCGCGTLLSGRNHPWVVTSTSWVSYTDHEVGGLNPEAKKLVDTWRGCGHQRSCLGLEGMDLADVRHSPCATPRSSGCLASPYFGDRGRGKRAVPGFGSH